MKPTLANEGVKKPDLQQIASDVETAIERLLEALRINWRHDPNTQETPRRVARMMVHEVFRGRFLAQPPIKVFPNTRHLDELYTVGPITIRSACSHHLVPILGSAWIGVVPNEWLIGLSKFSRLASWVMARPQIQEEAVVQLADLVEGLIKPKGLAVIVKAAHMCMSWRGVKDTRSEMVTSVMRGVLAKEAKARAEFMELIKGQGYR